MVGLEEEEEQRWSAEPLHHLGHRLARRAHLADRTQMLVVSGLGIPSRFRLLLVRANENEAQVGEDVGDEMEVRLGLHPARSVEHGDAWCVARLSNDRRDALDSHSS